MSKLYPHRNYVVFYKKVPDALKITLLSLVLVAFSLWLQGDIGLNLADEGFLWYGAIQTALGKVPIRDFQSYDPGRYYWTAAWLMLFGKGIISLRVSVGIFQFVGLTFGLLALRRVVRSRWMLAVAGFLLLIWMIPRHKVFESSLAMAGVYFAVRLIEDPSLRRHFISGIFVGIAAFFGRNHGLYSFLAFFLLILFIRLKLDKDNFVKRAGLWIAGILLGYSPMLIMMVVVPGFFERFIEIIIFTLNRGYTNIALPIPWPWRCDYSGVNLIQDIRSFSYGLFFLLLPLFYAFMAINMLLSKREHIQHKMLLMASTFVGAVYMHHIFSRADLWHLGQGIHPLLIGLLAIPFAFNIGHKKVLKVSVLLILLVMTLLTAGIASPYYQKADSPLSLIKYNIAGDHLWINAETARLIDIVKEINLQKVGQNEGLMIVPHWPGLYPILQRESPIRDIYFLHPQTEKRQEEIIEELKGENVNWVILGDVALDGREELRFRNLYEFVWQHFKNHFEPVATRLPRNYKLLRRKPNGNTPKQPTREFSL